MLDDLQEFLAPYRTTLDALFRHCCLTGRGAGQFDAEAGHIESNPNPHPNPKPNPNPNSNPNPNPILTRTRTLILILTLRRRCP